MKKVDNQSYNRIIEYLNNAEDIDENEKRYLVYYATQLYKNGVENIEEESIHDIYDALREFNESLMNCDDNLITKQRILTVLDILQKVSSHNVDKETLSEVSYTIDKLYCDADLPVRSNSSLSYNLLRKRGRNK